uniref:Uncharacterized protein n=1 Tax=Odontella aurita TaxID=265563 RepID=A0A7S4N525_9STRA|mmetsp:Transcript_47118/g.142673  ORF Transcript_47118/g.142673 Transcript_47118/m.142673 type:complete len:156 (+) Transcript_47118:726-1193(+)
MGQNRKRRELIRTRGKARSEGTDVNVSARQNPLERGFSRLVSRPSRNGAARHGDMIEVRGIGANSEEPKHNILTSTSLSEGSAQSSSGNAVLSEGMTNAHFASQPGASMETPKVESYEETNAKKKTHSLELDKSSSGCNNAAALPRRRTSIAFVA